MSSAFVALYGIYVKKALDFVGNNQWYETNQKPDEHAWLFIDINA